MEQVSFKKLYAYFNKPVAIDIDTETREVSISGIPIQDYRAHSFSLMSDFNSECNEFIERNKKRSDYYLLSYLEDIKNKFLICFNLEYEREFDKKLAAHEIAAINGNQKKGWLPFYIIKAQLYVSTFEMLDKQIIRFKERPVKSKSQRKRSIDNDFRLKLSRESLKEYCSILIEDGFLSKETSENTFIEAFSGRHMSGNLIWQGDQHSLKLFINNLIDKDCFATKIHDGKWEIVANIFKPHNKDFYTKQGFLKSSATRGKDYSSITSIVDQIAKDIEDDVVD
ncbi:hypothetical protein SLH46_06205 [Draconibacterium sp. IB214405]|uniref:hypothetical protein n=1 Tax=Draconibacterium sp. IB214405 TaxID=3097352 RepID=UPI002A0BA21B|nr:hypothetical protein [Draconibacterium sp. IB214405]MDX8338764.1 hypothetical protein [Draconibacterium sp. IB214405]